MAIRAVMVFSMKFLVIQLHSHVQIIGHRKKKQTINENEDNAANVIHNNKSIMSHRIVPMVSSSSIATTTATTSHHHNHCQHRHQYGSMIIARFSLPKFLL